MKPTGMIRRIDELGRIVIPKEIRKQLMMKEGESVSFEVEGDTVILRKFSVFSGISHVVDSLLEGLYQKYHNTCLVCDLRKIMICSSNALSAYQRKPISDELLLALKEEMTIQDQEMKLINDIQKMTVIPLKKENVVEGAIIMLCENTPYYKVDETLLEFAKSIIEQEIDACV